MSSRLAAAAMAFACALAIAGCGLGSGPGTSDVSVLVTRDFGARQLAHANEPRVTGSQTVLRLLERSFKVTTRFGGGFVESIDGNSGTGSQRDWFYYVNGIQAPQGGAGTAVHRGDRIWWDLHDWRATDSVPAVVGSFPAPFVNGSAGRRLPTVLECARDTQLACARVTRELGRLGIPVANQLLGTGSGTDSLTLEVATWQDLRGQIVGGLMARGPGSSGVYARFTASGHQLQLLDPRARVVHTLAGGAGLVAATAQGSSEPTWLVTGTDPRGVASAAAALTPVRLHNHFALALNGPHSLALPLSPGT